MKYISVVIVSILTSHANANSIERGRSNFDIDFIEGSRITANVDSTVGYNDNFFLSKQEEQSTSYISLNPEVLLQGHNDQHLGQLYVNGNYVSYDRFSEDNHTDISVLGKYFFKLAADHRLFISASYDSLYELRGEGITQDFVDLTDTGNERENTLFNIGYQFGRVDSVSRLNAVIGQSTNEYTTNRAITFSKDYERSFVNLDVDYLVSGKSYLTAVVEHEDVDYTNDKELSREASSALMGIKWRATDISLVSILLGYEKVEFDETLFESSDNFVWRANFNWQPIDEVSIGFTSSRRTKESQELLKSYQLTDNYGVIASYRISDYTRLTARANFVLSELNQVNVVRDDDEALFNLAYHYTFSERISMSLAVERREKDSTEDKFDFDKSSLQLAVKISL